MREDAKALVSRYLEGDIEAVGTINAWVELAGASFRKRLAWQWDDVMQAARMKVHGLFREGAFRGESSPRTYLWRVVNHVCIDHLRAQRRPPPIDIDDLVDSVASGEESPLDRFMRQESIEKTLVMLEAAPADCRRAWGLILAGRSYAEISEELGTTEGALRVKLLRCRRKAIALRAASTSDEGS